MAAPSPSRYAHRTEVDLADPDVWLEGVPHEEFTRLRAEAPVSWNERRDRQRGFWVIALHGDVVAVSRDTSTFSSREGAISLDDFDDDQSDARRTLLEMDPPQHTKMRKITARHFTPRAVSKLEAAARATAGELVDAAIEAGECDAVDAVSKHLPILTLCRLMGIPPENQNDMIRWSDLVIGSDDPEYVDEQLESVPEAERRLLPFGHPASLEAFDLGRDLAQDRLRRPVDDVMGALAEAMAAGDLTDPLFCNYFMMLIVAGNETTRHSLSHALHAFARHPGEWERFLAGGVDPNVAADEVLRWATAVHFLRRVATTDVELRGANILQGDKVALYYASANRDESEFEDPFTFVVDRSPNNHVAFGRGGPHFCLGAHVARLQIRVFLEELAQRVRRVEVTGDAQRLRSNHIHGIKHMPIILHPR